MDNNEDMLSGNDDKRIKPVEIGLDSDNEPIFKLKKPRCVKKKLCLVSEGTGGNAADSVGKFVDVVVQEDLGGMDDTLACFRKRLKGPKRDRGSRGDKEKDSNVNVAVESSDGSLNVSCQYEGLDEKSLLNKDSACEGQGAGENGSDLDMDMKTAGSCQLNVEGPNVDLALKGIEDLDVSEDGLVAEGSRNIPKDEKGVDPLLDAGLPHSSDETMGDSLSEILQPAQSSFVSKSCAAVSSEQKCGSQNVNDGLSLDSKSARKTAEGVHDSNIHDGPLADHWFLANVCHGDSQQLSCVQSEDTCPPSDQKDALEERILNDGLKKCSATLHDVEEITDTVSLPKLGKGVSPIIEGELKNNLTDDQAELCNIPLKCSDFTSKDKEKLPPCDSGPLTKSSENIWDKINHMFS